MSGLYAGATLGGVGGVLAEHFRWQTAFGLFGAVGVVYGCMLILCLRDCPCCRGLLPPDDAVTPPCPAVFGLVLLAAPAFLLGPIDLLHADRHRLLGDLCLAAHLPGRTF